MMKKQTITAILACALIGFPLVKVQGGQAEVAKPLSIILVNEFQPIKTTKVPTAVKKAIAEDFSGATLTKAFSNDSKEYKLVLKLNGQSQAKTVFANQNGKWIRRPQV